MDLDLTVRRWPSCDGCARQLSRKAWLDGREHGSQALEKTSSLVNIFPEDAHSRESAVRFAFSHRGALTVGFGFVAVAIARCHTNEGGQPLAAQRPQLRQVEQ